MGLRERVNESISDIVQRAEKVRAEELGLDPRLGSLYIDDDRTMVLVPRRDNEAARHYGGFEYVNEKNVIQAGDWVVYLRADDRIEDCFASYYGNESEE